MKEYSREERYRRIEDMDQKYFEDQLKSVSLDKEFYPAYHIAPQYGLLNDPNGLAEFNGEHHIFYQYHPIAPTHGLKYWYHLSTKDFIQYKDLGIALKPDTEFDSHGVFSGGALVDRENLILFFTGNSYKDEWQRVPSQAIAFMDKNYNISNKQQIIPSDPEFTGHFRDPKPWKKDDEYFLIIGAQTLDLKGTLVLYKGTDITSWRKVSNIKTVFDTDSYMYECPDYFELDDKGILIFSPQGMKSNDEFGFQNVYHVVYSIGNPLNLQTAEFDGQTIIEIDKGFDFYAPQTYKDSKGRRILYGWLGISDGHYPYDEENRWSQMLTIPRELTLDDNLLVQTPLPELEKLRISSNDLQNGNNFLSSTSFELELTVSSNFSIQFQNKKEEFVSFVGNDIYTLDRTNQGVDLNVEYGTIRKSKRHFQESQTIRIFYDKSALEIFADNGKTIFTSRVFLKNLDTLVLKGVSNGQIHTLRNIELCKL